MSTVKVTQLADLLESSNLRFVLVGSQPVPVSLPVSEILRRLGRSQFHIVCVPVVGGRGHAGVL